ncbi:MAG: hypothetical protein ACREQ9_12890 [Candidatus Binatia bacterium]
MRRESLSGFESSRRELLTSIPGLLDWLFGVPGLTGLLATLTVVLGVYWAPLIDFAGRSIRFFQG